MTYSLSKCLLFLRYTNIHSHKRYNRQSRSLHTIEVTTFTAYTQRTPHALTHTVTQTLQGRRVQQLHVITKAGTLHWNTDCDVWSKTGVFYEALELSEHDNTRSKPSGEYVFPCSLYTAAQTAAVCMTCVYCALYYSVCGQSVLSLHEGPQATSALRGGACARAAPYSFFVFTKC